MTLEQLYQKMQTIREIGLPHPEIVWLFGASARLSGFGEEIMIKTLSPTGQLEFIKGWCEADDILKNSGKYFPGIS